MPFGFDVSKSKSFEQSSGRSFVDQAQAPFLDFLRNQAQQQFGGFQQGAQQLQGQLGQLGQQAQQFGGAQNPFIQQLQGQAGGNPALVAQQTQQLGQDITQQLGQFGAATRGSAVGVGQVGGGRQGVVEGLGQQGALDAFQRGATGFQVADAQRAQQAGIAGGQLFGQGQQLGLQGLQQAGGFAQAGFGAGFMPLQALQQAFGGPTVLDERQATKSSSTTGIGVSGL